MAPKTSPYRAASALPLNQRKLLPGSKGMIIKVQPENISINVATNVLTGYSSKAREASIKGELGNTYIVNDVKAELVRELFKWANKACYEDRTPAFTSKKPIIDIVNAATALGMNLEFMQMPALVRSRLVNMKLVDLIEYWDEVRAAGCFYISRIIVQRFQQSAFLGAQAFHTKVAALQSAQNEDDHQLRRALEASLGCSQTVGQVTQLLTAFGTKRFVWDAVRATAAALKVAHPGNTANCPELTNAQVQHQVRSMIRRELQ